MLKRLLLSATLLFSLTLSSSVVNAAASTNVQVQNRSSHNVNICLRRVTWQGEVRWQLIGTVSTNRARTFGNVIIGSVIIAVPAAGSTSCGAADGTPATSFTVTSPPGVASHVVFSVP